mmetsp:Transcript_15433/g.24148  ORF Transcript_15433/g.24148 Transcript_15433/m.24148 type:complete len:425 (+) Transcript_15433:53-1327(+)
MTLGLHGKSLQAACLLASSSIGTLLPLWFVKKFQQDGQWNSEGKIVALGLSLGNALAGGVMLGTGLMHILTEAQGLAVENYTGSNQGRALYLPNLCCLIGILIPFFLEKSGLTIYLLQSGSCFTDHYANMHTDDHKDLNQSVESAPILPRKVEDSALSSVSSNTYTKVAHSVDDVGHHHHHHHHHRCSKKPKRFSSFDDSGLICSSKCVVPSVNATRMQGRLDFYRAVGSQSTAKFAPFIYPLHDEDRGSVSSYGSTVEDRLDNGPHAHDHPAKHNHMRIATFLMFLVLSIHSMLVGFTIGTLRLEDSPQKSAYLAVVIHKVFESLALGFSASQSPLTTTVKVELSIYNFAAPLGIIVGVFMQSNNGLDPSTEVMTMGLAAGSFTYIALVEVISEEFENEEYRIVKFLAFVLGAVVMSILAFQT